MPLVLCGLFLSPISTCQCVGGTRKAELPSRRLRAAGWEGRRTAPKAKGGRMAGSRGTPKSEQMKKPNPMMFQIASVFLFSLPWTASAQTEEAFHECLLTHTDDTTIAEVIYTTKSPSYSSVLDFYIQNSRFLSPETPKPRIIITPTTESQIQTAIYCSKEHGLQMRVRSGGHDFEGSSYISDVPFFILDMFNLRSISVDLETRTAWVGAGATLGETYYNIKEKKSTLAFPAGYWPTVAIGGHISGGGYGPLVRKYGLAADHVIDARIIDANGRILDRKSMGEALFWAIRGGVGSSFAVVLAFKLELVEVAEKITACHSDRTLEQGATKLVHKWQAIAPKLPVDLFLAVALGSITTETGGRTIQAKFATAFQGGIDELLPLMDKHFHELGLKREECTEMSWVQYFAYNLNEPIQNTDKFLTSRIPPYKPNFKGKAELVQQPIPEEGLEKIWKLFLEIDALAAGMEWTPFGGKMDEISESAIPFPHRAGNSFIVFKVVYWNGTDQKLIQQRLDWMNRLHNLMGVYVDTNPRAAYADYRDLDLGVNNIDGPTNVETARKLWGAPYFKNNFDRLVQVKTKIDPQDFFRNEQSIPPLPPLCPDHASW